jgi:hypothetical protein
MSSIISLCFLAIVISLASSQVILQNDPASNFYSVAVPNAQMSFYRRLVRISIYSFI